LGSGDKNKLNLNVIEGEKSYEVDRRSGRDRRKNNRDVREVNSSSQQNETSEPENEHKEISEKLAEKGTQILEDLKKSFKPRSDIHLKRKLFHALCGTGMALIYVFSGLEKTTMVMMCMVAFFLMLIVENYRLKNPEFNKMLMEKVGAIARENEVNSISGMPYYVGSVGIAVALFPPPVAILSILYLAWGDPVSSLVGIMYGRQRIFQNKSLEGTLGGFLVCTLITSIYLGATGLLPGRVLLVSILGGMSASVTELLPFNIDDNFSIPMISGFLLWLMFLAAGVV
jgi:dolichol kinase